MWLVWVLISAVPLALVVLLAQALVVIRHNEVALLETLGQYSTTKTSGFVFVLPLVQMLRSFTWSFRHAEVGTLQTLKGDRVPLQTLRYDPVPLRCTTADNFDITVDVVVSFRVLEPQKAVYGSANLFAEIEDKVETYLYEQVRKMRMTEATPVSLSKAMDLVELNRSSELLGIVFMAVRVQSIHLPSGMVDATVQIETQRLKDAAELQRIEAERKHKVAIAQATLDEQRANSEREIALNEHQTSLRLRNAKADADARKLAIEAESHSWSLLRDSPQLLPLAIAKEQTRAAEALGRGGKGKKTIIFADNAAVRGLGALPIAKELLK